MWAPAPFQSPGTGLGSKVTLIPKSSATRCNRNLDIHRWSPIAIPSQGPTWYSHWKGRSKICYLSTVIESEFSNLGNWKEEAWKKKLKKKSGLQWDSNPWPPRYWCNALPTGLWSHSLGVRSIYWVHISCEKWNDVKRVWNNSYLNCGCRWKWRMIIAVNFPI